jgi:TetR/AcrR family transcriptional repressor of nem operon
MRYTETHKTETHAKILKLAARALREKGPEKIAVAEVMQGAGLTHGGFYAHFKSKDAFLAETLAHIFAEAAMKSRAWVDGLPPRHKLAAYVDMYVSRRHRDDPANGCPIVALASDLPRQSKKFQATFDAGVKSLIDALEGWIADAEIADGKKLAPSILSAMSGAVTLSRAVTDLQLSDELLAAARAGIKARLGLTDYALSQKGHA